MKNVKKVCTVLLTTVLMSTTIPVSALTKDETVYSKLNSDGTVKKTVVSEYLKNTDQIINDKTNLQNILNLNGTEKYKLEGTNIVWDANGKDIYYQGETNKELPVSLDIKYTLDGKDISLKDLLGKSGNVKITLKYINHDKHQVLVNGKYETLYTPFVVTMGTIISNETNSNIEVTNGKVVSNGKSSVVVAIASPGLAQSLNTTKLNNFDTITISFDTDKFELSSMYSVVSSKLINHDDLNVFHKFDSIYSKVDTLSNSSKQLVEGSNKLKDGSKELNIGINKAYNGSKLLNNTLSTKISELENSEAIDNNTLNYINGEAKKGALAVVKSQEKAIKENALTTYISGLKEEIEKATNKGLDKVCIPGSIPSGYEDACTEYLGAIQINEALKDDQTKKLVSAIVSEVSYKTAEQTAVSTAETLSNNVATDVANTAKDKTVKSLKVLNQNVSTLTSGLKQLNDGSNTLSNGIDTLATGISKFDEEGISAISNLVNGDVKEIQGRLEALMKLGKAYDSFTIKDSATEGETKFVLVVDSQKVAVKNNVKKVQNDKKESIIDKIKNIFKK